jgi:hypothetical protein
MSYQLFSKLLRADVISIKVTLRYLIDNLCCASKERLY